MSSSEKANYIRNHFRRNCKIILVDIMKHQSKRKHRKIDHKRKELSIMGRRKYSCYICFEKFVCKEELDSHKAIHKDEEDDEVSGASTTKSSDHDVSFVEPNSSSSSETEAPQEEKGYKCLACDVNFQNQMDIKNHVHNQYSCKYFCKNCGRHFNTKGGFIVHVLQHDMKQTMKFSYKCEKCYLFFDDCYQLKRHYISNHNVVPGIKQDDSATEITQPNTSTVQKTESEAVPTDPSNPITGSIPIFDCDICYDVFASSKSLLRHKALHRELDQNQSAPICIDDDELEVVQKDIWPTPHDPMSTFTTIKKLSKMLPLPELTPLERTEKKPLTPKSYKLRKMPLQKPILLPRLTPISGTSQSIDVSKPVIEIPSSSTSQNKQFVRILNSGTVVPQTSSGVFNYVTVNPSTVTALNQQQTTKSTASTPLTVINSSLNSGGVLLNPLLPPSGPNENSSQPEVLKSLINIPGLDPTKPVYVWLPAGGGQKLNEVPEQPILMPVISSVETAAEPNSSDFVMPVITNITTIAEDSAQKEKPRKDPVSVYSNEFAKFIQSNTEKENSKKKTRPSSGPEAVDTVVIGESSALPAKDSDLTPSTVEEPVIKPKIFVKKLSDLMENSRKPSKASLRMNTTEVCSICNGIFNHWSSYKAHMQKDHGQFVCKFFRCRIIDGTDKDHMKNVHYCEQCKGEFRNLENHRKCCNPNTAQT